MKKQFTFFLIDVYWNPIATVTKECMGLFFSTKDIFGKFVEFNLLKGGAECSACEVNSMIKKRVRTMSFQPRKHSGMQQLQQKDTLMELIDFKHDFDYRIVVSSNARY